MLEARAAERGRLREQEGTAPEALAGDGAVGLCVDRQENAPAAFGLGHEGDDEQDVAVRIGVHGTGRSVSSRSGMG